MYNVPSGKQFIARKTFQKYVTEIMDFTTPATIIGSIAVEEYIKKFWKEKKCSYKEFLYYWYLPEVRRTWLQVGEKGRKKREIRTSVRDS